MTWTWWGVGLWAAGWIADGVYRGFQDRFGPKVIAGYLAYRRECAYWAEWNQVWEQTLEGQRELVAKRGDFDAYAKLCSQLSRPRAISAAERDAYAKLDFLNRSYSARSAGRCS